MDEPLFFNNNRDIYSVIRRHAPTSLIQDLINAGTDINTTPHSDTVSEFFNIDTARCTPLYWAAVLHNQDAMELLLNNGAMQSIPSNVPAPGMLPIHVIGLTGGNTHNDNRLHILSTAPHFNPSAQDVDGDTALHLAILEGPRGYDLIRQLTDIGVDPRIRDTDSGTVFHYVRNRLQLCTLLDNSTFVRQSGAVNCLHITDDNGDTPMHWVARSDAPGAPGVAHELIQRGVSLYIRNNDGDTPVDVAINQGTPVARILEAAIENCRRMSEAFFMGLQERIGMDSVLRGMPPEIADAIAEEAMGIERDGRLEM
jgi:ankyrin repeat protein